MVVHVSLSVASEAFPLGEVFRALPAARLDLDRVVPSDEALFPYVWVAGETPDTVRPAIARSEHVQDVAVLDSLPDRTLVRIEWEPSIDGLLTAITEQKAAILTATGNADRWQLGLRFPTAAAASTFHEACREADIRVEIESVRDATEGGPDRPDELTTAQREFIELTLDSGYYQIPRETTLLELAAELDVSDQAVGERLRRAHRKLAAAHLRN